jgi:catechol-2,3-dioxygenase
MHFVSLTLLCDDPPAQRDFYASVLGLAVDAPTPEQCRIVLPDGELIFKRDPQRRRCRYHVAFNIPHNQFEVAARWLEQRVALIADAAGATRFCSDDWNADMVYFHDAAGNISELIARHTLPASARSQPFDASGVLSISELGVAVTDVERGVAELAAETGAQPYHWSPPPTDFAPIGDEQGLFIVVKRGRIWFPETGIAAEPLPFEARVRREDGGVCRVARDI